MQISNNSSPVSYANPERQRNNNVKFGAKFDYKLLSNYKTGIGPEGVKRIDDFFNPVLASIKYLLKNTQRADNVNDLKKAAEQIGSPDDLIYMEVNGNYQTNIFYRFGEEAKRLAKRLGIENFPKSGEIEFGSINTGDIMVSGDNFKNFRSIFQEKVDGFYHQVKVRSLPTTNPAIENSNARLTKKSTTLPIETNNKQDTAMVYTNSGMRVPANKVYEKEVRNGNTVETVIKYREPITPEDISAMREEKAKDLWEGNHIKSKPQEPIIDEIIPETPQSSPNKEKPYLKHKTQAGLDFEEKLKRVQEHKEPWIDESDFPNLSGFKGPKGEPIQVKKNRKSTCRKD